MALDWITTVGIVSGLTGFSRSVYYVLFAILDKIHARMERHKQIELEEENEEKKGLLQSENTEIN